MSLFLPHTSSLSLFFIYVYISLSSLSLSLYNFLCFTFFLFLHSSTIACLSVYSFLLFLPQSYYTYPFASLCLFYFCLSFFADFALLHSHSLVLSSCFLFIFFIILIFFILLIFILFLFFYFIFYFFYYLYLLNFYSHFIYFSSVYFSLITFSYFFCICPTVPRCNFIHCTLSLLLFNVNMIIPFCTIHTHTQMHLWCVCV